jgi:hypothetical protein
MDSEQYSGQTRSNSVPSGLLAWLRRFGLSVIFRFLQMEDQDFLNASPAVREQATFIPQITSYQGTGDSPNRKSAGHGGRNMRHHPNIE